MRIQYGEFQIIQRFVTWGEILKPSFLFGEFEIPTKCKEIVIEEFKKVIWGFF